MALPSDYPFPATGDPYIDLSTHGYYWNLGPSKTINWSVSDNQPTGLTWNNPLDTNGLVDSIGAMLNDISYYIDVQFNYVGYFDSPEAAGWDGSDINLSLANLENSNIWGFAGFPNSHTDLSSYGLTNYSGAAGDVYLNINSDANALPSYEPGSAGWFFFLHEIGHALGLKHPHDDGGTGRPTFDDAGVANRDKDWISVMSYQDDYQYNLSSFDPATFMLLDVVGLQHIYGPNTSKKSGDSTWVLSQIRSYATYWDPSGFDTVDASTSTTGWSIELPVDIDAPVLVGMATPLFELDFDSPLDLFWLMGDMEAATGSNYADVITGNDFDNILTGNKGNDTLDGGAGIDFAVLSGDSLSQDFYPGVDSSFVFGPDGYDELINIERVVLDDVYVAIDTNGNGGQAYRLYQAAFDRTPDAGGVGYWMMQIDTGMALEEVSRRFIDSAEFQGLYGTNPSDYDFLETVYLNVLDRAPDGDGFNWWLDQMNSNPDKPREKVLADFSESPENQANVFDDIEYGFFYEPWLG